MSKVPDPRVKLNGDIIKKVNKASHLGNLLHTENSYECIDEGTNKFNCTVNMFLSRFKVCSPSIRIKLFQQYCMSLYGSQIWPLWHRSIDNLCTKWYIALRRVIGLPYRTHRDLLPLIASQMPIEVSLQCRLIKFYRSISASENSIVKYLSCFSVTSHSSTLGRNIRLISSRLSLSVEELRSFSLTKLKNFCYNKWFDNVINDYKIHASIISEMLLMKELVGPNFLENFECDMIIEHLCVS